MYNDSGNMKVFAGLVLVLILVFGAYYLGKASNSTRTQVAELKVSPTPNSLISSPTPTKKAVLTTAPIAAKLLSTNGWINVENKVISLKYPAETFSSQIAPNFIQLRWKNNTGNLMDNSPDFFIADNYNGGSRREWYLNYYSFYTNEVVFTDKLLGKISVLEARPKNEKATRDILVTNGKILVDVLLQGTDLSLVETIVSTIEFK